MNIHNRGSCFSKPQVQTDQLQIWCRSDGNEPSSPSCRPSLLSLNKLLFYTLDIINLSPSRIFNMNIHQPNLTFVCMESPPWVMPLIYIGCWSMLASIALIRLKGSAGSRLQSGPYKVFGNSETLTCASVSVGSNHQHIPHF